MTKTSLILILTLLFKLAISFAKATETEAITSPEPKMIIITAPAAITPGEAAAMQPPTPEAVQPPTPEAVQPPTPEVAPVAIPSQVTELQIPLLLNGLPAGQITVVPNEADIKQSRVLYSQILTLVKPEVSPEFYSNLSRSLTGAERVSLVQLQTFGLG